MAVTGRGAATKEQVAAMLQRIASFETLPKYLDATDALAVAVCHSLQLNPSATSTSASRKSKKTGTSWASFASQNPDKVINR
jgi:crossover junction endodeoxyribonuclease RuvC